MRIAIGGILHESNTFSSLPTDVAAFEIQRGNEVIKVWRDAYHEIGGFIEGGMNLGYEVIPTLVAEAIPAGIVTAKSFEGLIGELVNRIVDALPLDGLLLALHGAMVVETYPDGDGEVLSRLRTALGREFPIVATLDFHANISEWMVEQSTALVVYKTNPHVDQRERGLQAASIITRTIQGEVKPVQALHRPPMVLSIVHHNTAVEPLHRILWAARDLESNPLVLAANVSAGYPYADVHEMGPSSVVVTDDNLELARSKAQGLSNMLWDVRSQLTVGLLDAAEAISQAKGCMQTPVVIADMGDNIGGGAAGDSTFVLDELLRQDANGWVVVLADPGAVQECARVGVGAAITLRVGGKTDNLHGSPVGVSGRVKCLHDGQYEEAEPRHGGRRQYNQGLTAVVQVESSRAGPPSFLVLTTQREAPMSLNQLYSVGIQAHMQNILVVKAAIAYRAAYEPIAGCIIEADTSGLTAVNPSRFRYENVRRPLWGLDDISSVEHSRESL